LRRAGSNSLRDDLAWDRYPRVQPKRSTTNPSTVPSRGVSLHDLKELILYHNGRVIVTASALKRAGILDLRSYQPKEVKFPKRKVAPLAPRKCMHFLSVAEAIAMWMVTTPAPNHAASEGNAKKWFATHTLDNIINILRSTKYQSSKNQKRGKDSKNFWGSSLNQKNNHCKLSH
jgi:hypothetical protein